MKRILSLIISTIIFSSVFVFAEKSVSQEKDLYEYNNIVAKIEKVQKPFYTENYVVFTQKSGPRFIGIAFDFEDYKTIHSFMLHKTRDFDGNITNTIMFYILERPADISEFSYRLIIDGLWTYDPENPTNYFNEETGITLSKINLGETKPKITGTTKKSGTNFIYNGEPGQKVRLGGTFTNWDSWIYEMQETSPGFYELTLPLPTGKYYYNYYLGMNAVVDKTNPNRAYTEDGRTASVIVVQ